MRDIRAAVIGGSMSGKSFLTSGFIRGLWRHQRVRGIVFDPHMREFRRKPIDWGSGAWVTDNFAKWRYVVSKSHGCAIVWDEMTTHGGDEDENAGLTSEIRHNHEILFGLGHCHSAISRKLRVNLTDVYLALSDDVDAMLWARTMKDPELKRAALESVLPQYHFMHKAPYQRARIVTYTPAQIQAGILP